MIMPIVLLFVSVVILVVIAAVRVLRLERRRVEGSTRRPACWRPRSPS